MCRLIKQVFIILLSFSSSLETKCLSLNGEPCMARPILISLNLAELEYYQFMINLDKCNGSCKALSPKICVPKTTKDINIKVFNTITNKNAAKAITNIVHVIVNVNSIVQHLIQIKIGITKYVHVILYHFVMHRAL